VCYNTDLRIDPYYAIQNICVSIIDTNEIPDKDYLNTCVKKENFCNECCSYNMGELKEVQDKFKECTSQCAEALDYEPLELNDKEKGGFIISVN